jgi:hypothetical protein
LRIEAEAVRARGGSDDSDSDKDNPPSTTDNATPGTHP